jgi:hypothetical protein
MAKMKPWHHAGTPFKLRASAIGGDDVFGGEAAIYHDNDACPTGREIPVDRRAAGDGGYSRCPECAAIE